MEKTATNGASLSAAQRAWLWCGSIGPLGHVPASGTVTVAIVGVPLFWLTSVLPVAWRIGITLVFTVASVVVHDVGDRLLRAKDSRTLVWDEIAGFMVATMLAPFTWQTCALAFLFERALDIMKFPPGNWVERRWPGGLGVVGDDVVAGLYTCALLELARHYFASSLGLP